MIADTYPFTDDELALHDSGATVIPHAYTSLQHEVNSNCQRILLEISEAIEEPRTLTLLDRELTEDLVRQRTAMALEFLREDIRFQAQFNDTISESHARDILLQRAAELVLNSSAGSLVDRGQIEKLAHQVVSSVVALFLMGRVAQGHELMRLADTLVVLADPAGLAKKGAFKAGKMKPVSGLLKCLEILKKVNFHLHRFEIPTKALLQQTLGIDKGQASRTIKKSGLNEVLPNYSKRKHRFKRETLYQVPNPHDRQRQVMSEMGTSGFAALEVPASPFDLGSEGSPDRDIRLLLEKLGAAYHTFLIMFSMNPLESANDIIRFEENLKRVGVLLDWKSIRN